MPINFGTVWVKIDVFNLVYVVQSRDVFWFTSLRVHNLFGTDCHVSQTEGDVAIECVVRSSSIAAGLQEPFASLVDILVRGVELVRIACVHINSAVHGVAENVDCSLVRTSTVNSGEVVIIPLVTAEESPVLLNISDLSTTLPISTCLKILPRLDGFVDFKHLQPL